MLGILFDMALLGAETVMDTISDAVTGVQIAAIKAQIAISDFISGILNRNRLEEIMKEEEISSALVTMIDQCSNQVSIRDLDTDEEYTYQADEIADDINEDDVIYV